MNTHRLKAPPTTHFRIFPGLAFTALLAIACLPRLTSAATYYVSADGNDLNEGTSPEQAWASYEKAHGAFSALNAGDSIRFRRGDAFSLSGLYVWYNNNASAESPITIGDYGSPEDERPIIEILTTGFNDCGFYFENDTTSYFGGFVIQNLVIQGPGKAESASGSRGIRFRGSVEDVIVENVIVDGLRYGVQFQYFDPVKAPRRMVLRNSQIQNIEEYGFSGGGQDFVIEFNYWENCGSSGTADHHIYITSTGAETSNLIIRGNEMTGALQPGNANTGPDSQPIKVAGLIKGCLIEDNLIWEDPTAIENDDGGSTVPAFIVGRSNSGSTSEYYEDVTIRNNKVFNIPGLFWSFAGGQNFIVEDNIVISESHSEKRIGIGYANRSADDQPFDRVTIRNNEFLFIVKPGQTIGTAYGISLPAEGSNHSVTGNKIKFTGTNNDWFAMDLDGSNDYANYTAVDNNQFHYPNSPGNWEAQEGSLSAWQAATNFGNNSSNADPSFAYESNQPPLYGFASPLDQALSPPQIAIENADELPNLRLTLLGRPNTDYALRSSEDLHSWNLHSTVSTDPDGSASTIIALDPQVQSKFFRAEPE